MAHNEKAEESFFDQLVKFLTGPKKAMDKAANPVSPGGPNSDLMPVTGDPAKARESLNRAMEAKRLREAADAIKKPKKDPLAEALGGKR